MSDKETGRFNSFEALGGGGPGRVQQGSPRPPARQGPGGGSGYPRGGPPPDLPRDYLKGGYLDATGHMRREIFIEWPEHLGQSLRHGKTPVTKNSLRGFYSMLRMAKNQFDAQWSKNKDEAIGDARTALLKLHTAAQYKATQKVIPELCHRFLNQNINKVLEPNQTPEGFQKNFNAFVEHFQAVIAYLPER